MCSPRSCVFLLEKGSGRRSLGKPPPAPCSQSLQTHAHTLTLKHCPRTDRHSREDLALPVLDSSHAHPCAWCERRSPGTRSALSHREEGGGHARRRCSARGVALAWRPQLQGSEAGEIAAGRGRPRPSLRLAMQSPQETLRLPS